MLGRTYIPKRFNYTATFSIRTITDDIGETLIVFSDMCNILVIDSPSNIVRNMGLMHSVKVIKDDDGVRSYRHICVGKSAIKAMANEYSTGRNFFDWLLNSVYSDNIAQSIPESTVIPKAQGTSTAIQCLDSMVYQMVMLKNALTNG